MARLFVAVWPPDDVAERLRALRRKDQRGVRFVAPENWHVTLRFLGDADPDEVAGRLTSATFDATDVRLAPAIDVLGSHSLVIPAAGIEGLAAAVRDVTRDLGDQRLPRRFRGHLTLARLRRGARLPALVGSTFDASFAAEEISLVESRLHPDGARYETLATFSTRSTT